MTSTGEIVNVIIMTLYGDGWLLDLLCDHIIRNINVEPLCCTPGNNKYCYVNYTLIERKEGRRRKEGEKKEERGRGTLLLPLTKLPPFTSVK